MHTWHMNVLIPVMPGRVVKCCSWNRIWVQFTRKKITGTREEDEECRVDMSHTHFTTLFQNRISVSFNQHASPRKLCSVQSVLCRFTELAAVCCVLLVSRRSCGEEGSGGQCGSGGSELLFKSGRTLPDSYGWLCIHITFLGAGLEYKLFAALRLLLSSPCPKSLPKPTF